MERSKETGEVFLDWTAQPAHFLREYPSTRALPSYERLKAIVERSREGLAEKVREMDGQQRRATASLAAEGLLDEPMGRNGS